MFCTAPPPHPLPLHAALIKPLNSGITLLLNTRLDIMNYDETGWRRGAYLLTCSYYHPHRALPCSELFIAQRGSSSLGADTREKGRVWCLRKYKVERLGSPEVALFKRQLARYSVCGMLRVGFIRIVTVV